MTRIEFEERTGVINVSANEFEAIHTVYMASDLDKDEFCKMWCKMNRSRVERAKQESRQAQKYADLFAIEAKFLLMAIKADGKYDNEFADNFLTKKEKDLLSEFGIEMQGMNCYPYFKVCSAVADEVSEKLEEIAKV
jgi:hypothetical protein